MDALEQNPFSVQTPEAMSAQDIVDLFVDFFSKFFNVEKPGHTFLHGPRGSGKSMMLRFMAPDCQMLNQKVSLKQLPYFGVYASIKATDLRLIEFARLKNNFAEIILAEHAMVLFFAIKTIQSVDAAVSNQTFGGKDFDHIKKICDKILLRLQNAGWTSTSNGDCPTPLIELIKILDNLYLSTVAYLRMVSFSEKEVPYSGLLLGFHDFLLPLFTDILTLPFMPQGPIFLMVDDADNLSQKQTEILNTWVSSRNTETVCLKIATQLNYKTFRTVNGQKIDAPHDYSEVNIASVYTSSKDQYPSWVKEIVKRRLHKSGIVTSPDDFFPEDKEQENKIEAVAQKIKEMWPKAGRGYRPADDAYRYARSEYIKDLRGKSKQGSNYRYAGFKQILNISSGVIRHFLEAASLMYGEQKKRSNSKSVLFVEPIIQDKVLRELSDKFMLSEFDRMELDETPRADCPLQSQLLKNLVTVIGGLFQMIHLSDDSERRIFSFIISDEVDSEVKSVLKFGVAHGYFYESTIGTKEGKGRTKQFILNRMLAPHFLLDPTGFSAYKSVKNIFLRNAMLYPKATLHRLESKGYDEIISPLQKDLFSGENSQ